MKKVIDGEHIEMTAEEVSQYEADFKKMKDKADDRATAEENKKIKKASGKQKLKDLGLDDDEIKALMGA
jgi:hypothetical protein